MRFDYDKIEIIFERLSAWQILFLFVTIHS